MKNNLILYTVSIIALLFLNACKTNHYNEVSHKSKNENTYISKYKFKEPYTYKTPVSKSEQRLNQSKENSAVVNNINASTNDIIIVENKKYNNVPETENIVDTDLTLREKKEIKRSFRKQNGFGFIVFLASFMIIFGISLIILGIMSMDAGVPEGGALLLLGILLLHLGAKLLASA